MPKKPRYAFGEKIRVVRQRAKKTIKEVASAANISVSLLSQIENDKVSPSIDTLLNITEVLDIDLEYLFSELKKSGSIEVTRFDEQRTVHRGGATYRQLSRLGETTDDHAIDAVLLTLDPGGAAGSATYGHKGRELGYVFEGTAQLEYGTESITLHDGDSVTFTSEIPHELTNVGAQVLRALWIITPPRNDGAGY